FGSAVIAPQAVGKYPGLLLDRRYRSKLVVGTGVQRLGGFFGVHRADLSQTASATGGVLGPGIELARVAQRRVQEQAVQSILRARRVRQIRKRPWKRDFEQRRWGILRGLDRGRSVCGLSQQRSAARQAEIHEPPREHVQAVWTIR